MKNLLAQLKPESLELVKAIGALAQAQGMKAYLVGGPVRDLMLKALKGTGPKMVSGPQALTPFWAPSPLDPLDLDITVEGSGMRLAEKFAAAHGGKVTPYPAFKTATLRLAGGRLVDFVTARKETYVRPGAYPMVVPSTIKDDLYRRDFTVNAMAIAINPDAWGRLVDPFGGKKDLAAKRLRILHEKSFEDDATRILRLARFKARLGFRVERKTLTTLKSAVRMKMLDTIKPQRYLKDFKKIEQEAGSKEAMRILKVWKVISQE